MPLLILIAALERVSRILRGRSLQKKVDWEKKKIKIQRYLCRKLSKIDSSNFRTVLLLCIRRYKIFAMSETYSRHLLQAEVAHRFNKARCEITARPKVPVITGKTVREITNVTCGCWYIDDACDAKCRQHRNQLNAIPRGNVLDRRASSQLSSAFSSSLLWSAYVAWTGEHICVYMCTRVCGRECIARDRMRVLPAGIIALLSAQLRDIIAGFLSLS